jgi:hypothetical protein
MDDQIDKKIKITLGDNMNIKEEESLVIKSAYNSIIRNPALQEQILNLFLKQNFKFIFSGNERLSLLTSEPKIVTVRLIPLNSKPYEE